MAGFKMHIATSTTLGVGYGAAAHFMFDVPPDQCVLAAAMCSVSGMLPDLDSDSGVPLRESLAFAAAVVPMLLLERFRNMGLTTDTIILVGAGLYAAVRFGIGGLLRRYTVHRGMFHSIPAAIIAGEVAFLLIDDPNMWIRLFKTGAVVIGFTSHLLLDEFYSVEMYRGRLRLKSSFGTAFKFYTVKKVWPNVSTYAKLAVLTWLIVSEQSWMNQIKRLNYSGGPAIAEQRLERQNRTAEISEGDRRR